jgi:CDP-paratose 2-epimerase
VQWSDWRPGDQHVFVSNIGKARERLGWKPQIGVEKGVKGLIEWVRENRGLFP